MDFKLAAGWGEVGRCTDAPDLLVEVDGRLLCLGSDFSVLHDFGPVGPVDCPIAYDAETGTAYRYACAAGFRGKDYSQLRAYDLKSGEVRAVLDLPLNKWVLWLLEWIDGLGGSPGQLLGLLATDRPADDRVIIDHQLFVLKPRLERQLRVRPMCRDAYRPLAFSRQRREFVFAGAEGIYLLGMKGERLGTLPVGSGPSGYGATFDPSGGARVVVGGDGLYLWDIEANMCKQLVRQGRHPVWSSDGSGIWYRVSSSDLYYYNLSEGRAELVLEVRGNRHPEVWQARPVELSACGRYLAVSFKSKKLRGVSRKTSADGMRERVFENELATCILDLQRHEFSRWSGFSNQICWAEKRS